MVKINGKYWKFPYFGSLFSLIAFLFPAAWAINYNLGPFPFFKLIWMIGLIGDFQFSTTSSFNFHPFPLILISSIVCSSLIIIFNLVLLKQTWSVRRGDLEMEDVENNWMFLSITTLIVSLTWMVLIHVAFIIFYGRTVSFWRYFYPGLGLILIFLGSFITVTGILIKKRKYDYLH